MASVAGVAFEFVGEVVGDTVSSVCVSGHHLLHLEVRVSDIP
jgi:hypothetical protein